MIDRAEIRLAAIVFGLVWVFSPLFHSRGFELAALMISTFCGGWYLARVFFDPPDER